MARSFSLRRAGPGCLLALWLVPGLALGWWNGEWTGRKPIRLDTSASGANVNEPVGTVPVLVRLHLGNFQFDAASETGADLRFVAGDDQTPLPHHVEKYDSLLGEALIWVKVPDVKPGTKTEFWLYYGNPKAPSADDAKGTYEPTSTLVYHFAELGQPPADSTAYGNKAEATGGVAEGAIIARGLRLDGATAIAVPGTASLAWNAAGGMTWSAWVKPVAEGASGVVFARGGAAGSLAVGLDAGKVFVEVGNASGVRRVASTTPIPAGWHHLAVTGASAVELFVDGRSVGTLDAPLPALDAPLTLGGPAALPAAVPGAPAAAAATALGNFRGDLDEMQLANVVRPAGWVQVSALSQGSDPGRLVVLGQDEEAGGAHTGYFGVLIGAVTLDGWIVIGLLAVMSVVSWWVMSTKAGYLRATQKANDRFQEIFARGSADLARMMATRVGTPEEEKAIAASPLFHIYGVAANEVRKRLSAGRPIGVEAIESIRASMDATLVRENQRLSSSMVLLTIAISGGPFLGLLGTVVGVMIVFAAVAAAGDVNVNAIAPGIAAALVATVAGLGVAIPALFGYNYLLTRAKEITATMQVFVDELVTKLAEAYAGNGRREAHDRPTLVPVE